MADTPREAPAPDSRSPSSRSLDYLTVLGVTVAVGAIVTGNWLEGGDITVLLQLTAFVIVLGGTLGAVLIQTSARDFRLAVARLGWVFRPPRYERALLLERVMRWSQAARRDGLLALEKQIAWEDAFVQKGMRLLVDGLDPEEIRGVMDVEIDAALSKMTRAGRLYESMGGYSPTIGIIGAVLGLIHVMNNLTDPSELGTGVAVAFVATIYGVGFANLFFLPVSNKLKSLARHQMEYHEMVVDGLVMIADGDTPTAIRSKLEGYLD
jgi:chemotaxis protein MotA